MQHQIISALTELSLLMVETLVSRGIIAVEEAVAGYGWSPVIFLVSVQFPLRVAAGAEMAV